MKQNQYEEIITCIQFGAPALSQELINAFVQVVQNSNEYISEKQRKAEEANKAKLEEERIAQEKAAKEKAAKEANLGLKKSTK